MITVAILVFLVLMLLGVPVAFAIGAAGLAGLAWSGEFPLIIIMQQIHQSVGSLVLLAIPPFLFAGMLLENRRVAARPGGPPPAPRRPDPPRPARAARGAPEHLFG